MWRRWTFHGPFGSSTFVHRWELSAEEHRLKASPDEARSRLQSTILRHADRDGSTHRIAIEILEATGSRLHDLRQLSTVDLLGRVGAAVSAGTIVLLDATAKALDAPGPPKVDPAPDPPAKPKPAPPKPAVKKELKTHWQDEKVYCGDDAHLLGEGKNLGGETDATATVTVAGKSVATLKGKGDESFDLTWAVKDVVFEGDAMPEKKDAAGELKAAGLTAKTEKALAVLRVPDVAPAPVTFARASGIYGWTAAFRAGIKKGTVDVAQTLQLIPAWLGKWVAFVQAQDGVSGWGFIKKVGVAWKYWDVNEAAADKWKALPRAIASYTVNTIFFIKAGAKFVGRDDATQVWPEAFADAPDLATKKSSWLGNIHSVWDNKFNLHRKTCKSTAAGCCTWRIRIKVNWSDAPGDRTVYAVWAQEWERSNAKDWFLTETRLGVAAHECGHLLGAYDEYVGGAVDLSTNKIEVDSIMGQNLTKGYPRQLDGFRDEVKKIVDKAVSRTWTFEVKDA